MTTPDLAAPDLVAPDLAAPDLAAPDPESNEHETFDEIEYLRIHQDVAQAIARGEVASGYAHYVAFGVIEGRALPSPTHEPRNRLLVSHPTPASVPPHETRFAIDSLIVAPAGGLMIVGWINDAHDPIQCIRIAGAGWRVTIDRARFVRVRRHDVEQALDRNGQHPFGFFGFLHFDRMVDGAGPCLVEIWLAGGSSVLLPVTPQVVGDIELRDIALTHLGTASFAGNAAVERVACLDAGFGDELVRFNRAITRRIVATPYVERFGPTGKAPGARSPRGTIVVCLYGRAEYLFLQNCLFAGLPGIEDYEFIYVSNSPEIGETLLREARSSSLVYGLPQTVMILPGNAGFSGANNAAAAIARSGRILAVNPDVFPRDPGWARKHLDVLDNAPAERTRLFGVPLYYDDGSLMHGGMFIDVDIGLSMASGIPRARRLLRVEHYGKGAPADATRFTRSRPVPAISGAFISIDRAWFERLGGFSEDYLFGHYEDADLSLKSIAAGTVPWLHDIRMWHLEGKGSTRLPPHEGGSAVNRWLFSRRWSAMVEAGLKGPSPTYPAPEAFSPGPTTRARIRSTPAR